MSGRQLLNRRRFLARGSLLCSALALGSCEDFTENPAVLQVLDVAESLNHKLHRLLLPPTALAREYSEADISAAFRANGSTDPEDEEYRALARDGFRDWRLEFGGLVRRAASYSLEDLRRLPPRTQITRHDCVEGWSCIGKWKGVPLATLIDDVGLKPEARYIAFYCADTLGTSFDASQYYESIGLDDARHPQTILAYDMNDAPLKIAYGAPLRLRLERQLGYKMAKYIMRIEAVASLSAIQGGRGGYWEDRGYEWYAGI
ncbi:molybdopterin-binding protein [Bradyrhizobium sp. CB82]|uniref:molybdopterin-binding protein n=1 Tax=Bradyrhizobium sp. CB82 TaxID=3039159 RepID=UPI0024B14F43|nr:molybdopterin-binding protein [Bradyrhizobium sp. CB82]WFU41765.1 molybdopterin-binding protein [Bradyrhizobium sp. CB82]